MAKWKRLSDALALADQAPDSETALPHLRDARRHLDDAINEAMADVLINADKPSLRAVAGLAGFTENAVGPRLGSTSVLADYARGDGRVTTEGVYRARYDRENRAPMRFTKRKDD